MRRLRRRKEVAWIELCLEVEKLVPADDDRHDAAIHHLPECLSSLGPTAREALDLHYRNSLGLSAIGTRLHRSEGAVKLVLFRARQALRLCLNGKLQSGSHD
jgi:RNA polymerase sigma-70 factor (ECF subfamily)